MSWYIRTAERELGPISEDALRALVSTGQVGADALIRAGEMSGWTSIEASGLRLFPEVVDSVETALPQSMEPAQHIPSRPCTEAHPFDIPATPWRRFWARMLDILLDSVLLGVTVGALRPSLLDGQGWAQLLLSIPCALLIDCVLYALFGTTPGQALAGIRVVTESGGGRLTFRGYFKRSVELYIFGLGLGLPLVNLVTLLRSYWKLAAGETLSWDQFAESIVVARSASWVRTSIVALTYLALFVGLGLLDRREQQERTVRQERARETDSLLRAEQELQSMARTINDRGPMFVRPNNRFDSAQAGPGLMFTYSYTMTAMRKSQLAAQQLEQFRQQEQNRLFETACRGSLIYMFDKAQTLRAHYVDRDGEELATAEVRRADCGWKD